MTKLTPLKLDDGTVIYIETTEDVQVPEAVTPDEEKELTRGDLGKESKGVRETTQQIVTSFQALEGTIRAYTNHTLNAFRKVANANVNKVTLEFGLKVGGEAGVPYITKGTAESNLKITVECSFPDETTPDISD